MPDLGIFGPACQHQDCTEAPAVQWQRRPTDGELAGLVGAEVQRREMALLLADPQLPPLTFGPLPTYDTTTIAVMACRAHAIDLDAAAQVHATDCPAPHPEHLPACGCSPEALPPPVPMHMHEPTVVLLTGWSLPA